MPLNIILLSDSLSEFNKMNHYDYIFAGAGLSSLMTVYEMMVSEKFNYKSILLLEADTKKNNDRTWCFWENPNGAFENIVHKKWDFAWFANENFSRDLDLNPYQYKMIRGLDFYNSIFEMIKKKENITFINEKVIDFSDLNTHVLVETETLKYTCDKLFNSIYNPEIVKSQTRYPLLQQHFIGWFIKTKEAVFTPEKLTFMDFSIPQKGNTLFMYVLPTSPNEALLEPTLFSHQLLKKEEYEAEIHSYAKKLGITEFEIVEKEQGNIPMTSYPFWKNNTKNILNIGSAGGWTKASTGFTFKHTSKKSKKLVAFLQSDISTALRMTKFEKRDKFWFYDLLFLDVLDKNNELGSAVFSSLFKKGNPVLILKFLDEETSFIEDLQVMLKCPKIPFIKALLSRLIR
jgi:lycopene beta-cyclase